jgi:hypothetical protein
VSSTPPTCYDFDYNPSQLRLGAKAADPAPRAALWQLAADGTAAEDFSFEDAGGGSFYIRSRLSNLYLTADTPAAGGIPTTTPVPVVLRPKSVPGTTPAAADVGLPGIQAQKWLIGISTGPTCTRSRTRPCPTRCSSRPTRSTRPRSSWAATPSRPAAPTNSTSGR